MALLSIEAMQNMDKGMLKGGGSMNKSSGNTAGGGASSAITETTTGQGQKKVKLISPIVNPKQFVDMIEVMVSLASYLHKGHRAVLI